MKRISILFFAFILAMTVYCQNYLQDGDRCFDSSDYACAITKYNEAFKSASGKEKQIAEIKLTRAKWCFEHISTANQVFNNRNYLVAKDEYQKVLDSNPKDSYVQSQIVKCDNALNQPKLRKATVQDIADIWNNKYGVMPIRRQNLINAGIDPDEAQNRINKGEGKPSTNAQQETTLSIATQNISFYSLGGKSQAIKVYSNTSTYSIALLPSWCSVQTYSGYFILTCTANNSTLSRSDWFQVTSGNKAVKVFINQAGLTPIKTSKISKESKPTNFYLGLGGFKPMVFANNGKDFANKNIGYNLMIGFVRKVGLYTRISTNFSDKSGDFNTTNLPSAYYVNTLNSSNSSFSRFGIVAGVMLQTKSTIMYAGAGRGTYYHLNSVDLYKYYDNSFYKTIQLNTISLNGLETNAGIIFKVNKLALSCGVSSILFKYLELNMGIGIIL